MSNRTFTIIKPDSVAAGNTGKIVDRIIGAGFTVRAMRMIVMSRNDAARFYAVHCERPFFEELIDFMTAGACIVAILEKDNAVAELRKLVGSTDPAEAAEGTIRRDFGQSRGVNAIHASDSDENAAIEMNQFFAPADIVECKYNFQ